MIDNLISSYRAQIYDWSATQWLAFLKKKWKPVLVLLIFLLLPIGIYVFGASKHSSITMLLSLFAEVVPIYFFDHYTVKYHVVLLRNKQSRLKEAEDFLKNVIPGVNLFQKEIIDELIKRLSAYIDQRAPFKNFLKGLDAFTKSIILPIITYVAGLYSSELRDMSINIVATYAISIIILLGIIKLSWTYFSEIAKVFCRNYNAAGAFREDLLDLRLLYFTAQKEAQTATK